MCPDAAGLTKRKTRVKRSRAATTRSGDKFISARPGNRNVVDVFLLLFITFLAIYFFCFSRLVRSLPDSASPIERENQIMGENLNVAKTEWNAQERSAFNTAHFGHSTSGSRNWLVSKRGFRGNPSNLWSRREHTGGGLMSRWGTASLTDTLTRTQYQPNRRTFIWEDTVIPPRALRRRRRFMEYDSATHANRTRTGKIIYFLHIHKSAGTAMCQAMKAAGLSSNYRYPTNCLVQRDQRCCGRSDTLEAQREFANRTRFDFVANERDMYEAMDTESYYYTTTLRKSRDRYFSHFSHVVRQANDRERLLTFREWYSRQPDNWNTRKICGTRCSQIPKFQLSREDFSYTVDRLKRFSAILFQETFDASLNKFADRFNLTLPEDMQKTRNVGKKLEGQHEDPDDWDPLMSSLDDALYEIAMRLEEGRRSGANDLPTQRVADLPMEREHMLDEYFLEGKQRGCPNPCCASECSLY